MDQSLFDGDAEEELLELENRATPARSEAAPVSDRTSTEVSPCATRKQALHEVLGSQADEAIRACMRKLASASKGLSTTEEHMSAANSAACSLLAQLHGLSTLIDSDASGVEDVKQLVQESLQQTLSEANAVLASLGEASEGLGTTQVLHEAATNQFKLIGSSLGIPASSLVDNEAMEKLQNEIHR